MFIGQRGEVVIVRTNAQNPKKPQIEKIGSVGDPLELEKVIKRDDWNDYTVITNGNQSVHIINGQVMSKTCAFAKSNETGSSVVP